MTHFTLMLNRQFNILYNKLNKIFSSLERINARRRTIEELNKLSDQELLDIGISRYDILAIADGRYIK